MSGNAVEDSMDERPKAQGLARDCEVGDCACWSGQQKPRGKTGGRDVLLGRKGRMKCRDGLYQQRRGNNPTERGCGVLVSSAMYGGKVPVE